MLSLSELKEAINNLSPRAKEEILSVLKSSEHIPNLSTELEEARFSKGIFCPKCGCTEGIVRYGRYRDKQRFLCRSCNKTFCYTSNSLIKGTHKSLSVWEEYIKCMFYGLTIKKTAQRCNISTGTAFIWRHKILDVLTARKDKNKLSGLIEADETFFRVSYKGTRKLASLTTRPPKRRGERPGKRGLSREQVCVVCAIDRKGNTFSKVSNLGKISTDDLTTVYHNKISGEAIFCTDSEKSYRQFVEKNKYRLIQIPTGKYRNGVYHINHINAFHSKLKHFMNKFRGISTKYLDNYLSWMQIFGKGIVEVMKSIVSIPYSLRARDITNRPAIPVA